MYIFFLLRLEASKLSGNDQFQALEKEVCSFLLLKHSFPETDKLYFLLNVYWKGVSLQMFKSKLLKHSSNIVSFIADSCEMESCNYVLSCLVLYCIVLYCIVLYCIVLYCIVLYKNMLMVFLVSPRSRNKMIFCFYLRGSYWKAD